MKNEIIKTDIHTGIAQFPSIMNANNESISKEFDIIKNSEDKLIIDVSSNEISAKNAFITNITVDRLNIVNTTIENYVNDLIRDSSYISELVSHNQSFRTADLSGKNSFVNETAVYGAGIETPEYDMSSFFSSTPKGVLKNLSTDDLYHVVLYRVIENQKIPLSVGSIVTGGKFRMMIYHDHIFVNGAIKKVERVFVPVVNSSDKKNIVQYGPAETISLS